MVFRRHAVGVVLGVLLTSFQACYGGAGGSISNKPTLKTDKPKIQWVQAFSTAYSRDPTDEDKRSEIKPAFNECEVGENDKGVCKVHPLVVTYLEQDAMSEQFDVYAAISLDEGATWKRTNLSNNANKQMSYKGPCFTTHSEDDGDVHRQLHEDEDNQVEFKFYGSNYKPQIVTKGNNVLVAWTSKNCKGGVPGNQKGDNEIDPDPTNALSTTDVTDKYLVKGRQMCTDYEGVVGLKDRKSVV